MHNIQYLNFGDRAITIELGKTVSTDVNQKVRAMYLAILQQDIPGIISVNPTYRSITVEYQPHIIMHGDLINKLKKLELEIEDMKLPQPNILIVPTLYGSNYGPDMQNVMQKNNLTEKEVITLHTSEDYLVYMLGFTPGFAFLGGMDERLETPRLATPRVKIKGGTVGIAGKQTGIYSIDSPGGWQLIGHTPIRMYDANRENPILHKSGDYIRFRKINEYEYEQIKNKVDNGTYVYEINAKEVL